MAFKPNYRQERAARNQAKEQRKQAKLAKREAEVARRRGDGEEAPDTETNATVPADGSADLNDAPTD